ncbi:PREDICTED: uncharacterized protein LOC108566092 [Nicrophorus vespilloides]|uniref:Uncharacterized protein LOC108566092 n=1 Tax=Nicrophorus vespilloides TaxID=110193 RepID=A0ABM1N3A4_NICVS|nr:PREDICTED: uncharacterized protein LOC108566092 [Nicrophorus vespilloides]
MNIPIIDDNTKLDVIEKRVNSVPKEHLEALINFVDKHRILLRRQFAETSKVKRLWVEFANEVSSKHSPYKTSQQWKQLFAEWKTCTKKKIRIKKVGKYSEMSIIKTVSDLDRRLLDLIMRRNVKDPAVYDLFADNTNENALEVETVDVEGEHDVSAFIREARPRESLRKSELFQYLQHKLSNILEPDANTVRDADNRGAILQLSDAIIKFTEIYKVRTELEKVRVHAAVMNAKANYYQTFGTLNGFNEA